MKIIGTELKTTALQGRRSQNHTATLLLYWLSYQPTYFLLCPDVKLCFSAIVEMNGSHTDAITNVNGLYSETDTDAKSALI